GRLDHDIRAVDRGVRLPEQLGGVECGQFGMAGEEVVTGRVDVFEPSFLGGQIVLVPQTGCGGGRDNLGHRHAGGDEPFDLERVVGEEPDRPNAQTFEDLRCLRIVAGVDGETQTDVGVDRVGTRILGHIGAQLVYQADAPALVAGGVDEDAGPVGG